MMGYLRHLLLLEEKRKEEGKGKPRRKEEGVIQLFMKAGCSSNFWKKLKNAAQFVPRRHELKFLFGYDIAHKGALPQTRSLALQIPVDVATIPSARAVCLWRKW
jgi:hypothetical protein